MITLFLAACGGVEEPTTSEDKDESVSSQVENESEEIQKNEDSDAKADVFKTSSEKEKSIPYKLLNRFTFNKALFSKFVDFGEKKLIVIIFNVVKKDFIFEKRAANLVRMQKVAFSTLKSAFGF
jgi:hypothetical protein